MAKLFLSGIRSKFITDLDDPILPLDGVNKQYVDIVAVPSGGNTGQCLVKLSDSNYDTGWSNCGGNNFPNSGMHFHGGSFTTPANAFLYGGSF
jgi:hypothetical protein